MDWLLEPLQYQFIWRGLLIAMLLGVSGGLLGCVMVLRRMALMGDALSHGLLPGIGIAYLLFGPHMWALFLGALGAGLLTAIGSGLITRLTRIKEDAAFGALFVLFFGVGVALVSKAQTRVELLHFLFGNILGVSSTDLWLAVFASVLTLSVFALFYRNIVIETFDPVFHRAAGGWGGATHIGLLVLIVINLVAALQAMGVVLALGLFLLPAVTAYLWCDRWGAMLIFSVLTAIIGSAIGLLVSFHVGIASGPCMVTVLGAGFLFSAVFSPYYGVVAKFRKSRRHYAEPQEPGRHTHEH